MIEKKQAEARAHYANLSHNTKNRTFMDNRHSPDSIKMVVMQTHLNIQSYTYTYKHYTHITTHVAFLPKHQASTE